MASYNYGSFESAQSIEVEAEGEYCEAMFRLDMNCVSPGCKAQLFGPPENCYPAEDAEFELDTIHVLDGEGNPTEISEDLLSKIIGPELVAKLIERAVVDAHETMEPL